MLIYFSCSIRGGRQKEKSYEKIVQELKKYGNVLNEEISKPNLEIEEIHNTPEQIYNKEWFHLVDCSPRIAKIISEINYGNSIGELITGKKDPVIKRRCRERGKL